MQDLHFIYEAIIGQQFLSTSTLLDRHEELCELHLVLRARHDSAVSHYRDQSIQCKAQTVECKAQADHEVQGQLKQVDTQLQIADTQLREASSKYDKLVAQVTKEDFIFQKVISLSERNDALYPCVNDIVVSRPHLRPKDYIPWSELGIR